MKRLFTAVILSIFVFNICGYYIPYLLKLSLIRNEVSKLINESVPDEFIVKLTFTAGVPAEQPEWVRDGREFRYMGNMYDVVKSESRNGSVTYYCINDKDEKTLASDFNKLLNKKLNDDGKSKTNPQKELSKYYSSISKETSPSLKSIELTDYILTFYKSKPKEILSPPPENSRMPSSLI